LPAPSSLTGSSLAPLLQDPSRPGKSGAFGYWRGRRTLRTDRYRITRYSGGEQPAVELFDHQNDPLETVNVAASHPEVVNELLAQLEANQPSY